MFLSLSLVFYCRLVHIMHSIQRRCYRRLSRQQVFVLLCCDVKVVLYFCGVIHTHVVIASWSYKLKVYMCIAQITLGDIIFR